MRRDRRIARHELIKGMVQENRIANIAWLADRLNVSKMTILRDLRALEKSGAVLRLRGAAISPRDSGFEPPYAIRKTENAHKKAAISKYAAGLIETGDVITLDVGTTLLALTKLLPEDKDITVITNWIPVARELMLTRKHGIKAMIVGGSIRLEEQSIIGSWVHEIFKGLNVAKAFIGVAGVDPARGFTDYDLGEIEVKKTMINASRKTFILADSTKFGRIAPYCIPITKPVTVITDSELDPRYVEAFAKHEQVKIIRVDLEGNRLSASSG